MERLSPHFLFSRRRGSSGFQGPVQSSRAHGPTTCEPKLEPSCLCWKASEPRTPDAPAAAPFTNLSSRFCSHFSLKLSCPKPVPNQGYLQYCYPRGPGGQGFYMDGLLTSPPTFTSCTKTLSRAPDWGCSFLFLFFHCECFLICMENCAEPGSTSVRPLFRCLSRHCRQGEGTSLRKLYHLRPFKGGGRERLGDFAGHG